MAVERREPAHWAALRQHPDPMVREMLAQLEAERDAWRSRDQLGKLVDLSGIPDSALPGIEFAPGLYYPPDGGSPQFEFQRTPNLFPTGRIAFGGAGLAQLETATAFGAIALAAAGPFDVVPQGAREWKLLGGLISASAACTVLLVNWKATRCYAAVVFAAAGSQPFTIPGNGGRVAIPGPKRGLAIACSAIANVDFALWVAEEVDVT